MSLKCLICRGGHRTNSDLDYRCAEEFRCCDKLIRMTVERTWSSPLTPPPYDQVRGAPPKSAKGRHHRLHSSGPLAFGGSRGAGPAGEPRLVRSWGMRRDWSFENLGQWRDGKRRDETVLQ
ncbi:uncharacterized protein LOC104443198 [Eucalyptus grandis]|uniref:Uncharacterized protein n=2 Tax=Eucalyptus grandis TaxID=71139 RepID=A0ACC3L791_EUCGR|nr:uncharacterized protein LOC104443198 [Eucalyptus grandis]KAK3434756.1 hypothetical protein EUGRSUZ_D02199 [Eucalyptus grandis]